MGMHIIPIIQQFSIDIGRIFSILLLLVAIAEKSPSTKHTVVIYKQKQRQYCTRTQHPQIIVCEVKNPDGKLLWL